MHMPPLSTELALRSFEADAAFSAALAQLQRQLPGLPTVAALGAANDAGFSWLFRPVDDGSTVEAVLRHAAGAEEKAIGGDPQALVLGLLGVLDLPQAVQAAEPEIMQKTHKPTPAPEPAAAVEAAAESLAAATSGAVVAGPDQPGRAPDDPLNDAEKAACVAMVKAMDAAQRKSFTIHFRTAFKVPSEEKAIAPLMTSFKHLDFVDRFTGEAAGVPRP
jgi:hypothetical protein